MLIVNEQVFPIFFLFFFTCLYQKYLSENIEQPSAVFLGIDEQAEIKKNKNINNNFLFRITNKLIVYLFFFLHSSGKINSPDHMPFFFIIASS